MNVKKSFAVVLIAFWILLPVAPGVAQVPAAQDKGQVTEEQAALEKKALDLLDRTIGDGRSLRLPENRARVQFTAGDLVWKRDEKRARGFFAEAAASCAEMISALDVANRRGDNQIQVASQLRQEMLMVVARRDAELALEFLRATRFPSLPQNDPAFVRGGFRPDQDANIEASLLVQLAANDPKLALRLAEESLDKGEYSSRLVQLLSQLQDKDKAAADKLADKIARKLRSENLLTNQSARGLATSLLSRGPRAGGAGSNSASADSTSTQVLDAAAYRDLLEAVIASGLSFTQSAGQPTSRGGPGAGVGGRGPGGFGPQFGQNGGIGLLMALESLLPQIDKNLPGRSQAVRQKLKEMGVNADARGAARSELNNLTQQGSVDAILQTASTAAPDMQNRLYLQAARKALNEGNADRATQIATEHLNPEMRKSMLQEVDRQKFVKAALESKIEEIRPALAVLRPEEERINVLSQMATAVGQAGNRKLALELLDEASSSAGRRAENYAQLEAQLKVAHAYAALDPSRSFDALQPGINQINEMLSAATLLNGFEVRVFKDGEMPLQGGSQLSEIISNFARELGSQARLQFDAAQAAAEKFQRPEARIIAHLAIARGVLEVTTPGSDTSSFRLR